VDGRSGTTSQRLSVTSTDGRAFQVVAAAGTGLSAGDYLTFADDVGREHLGFVEEVAQTAEAEIGAGSLLTWPTPPAEVRHSPGRRSDTDRIAQLLAGRPPEMEIGRLVSNPEVGVGLLGSRLNRHTFWCGQSGSGKTYALGVAIEQILLNTRLPVVIFDPNSDFVRLDEARPGADPGASELFRSLDIRILRPGEGPGSLRVRFRSMTSRAWGAILQLDPIVDRHEYNALLRSTPVLTGEPEQLTKNLRSSAEYGGQLAERLENLEILAWQTWARDYVAATDIIAERPAATVLDLGGFNRVEEQLTVALAVLDDLWARREERRPVLLVIDEAHNLCAPGMDSLLGRAVRDRIIQIAAEGRKFGLWLLISTQRPSKVHPQIVSQCDNLTLMRMNSPGDLAELTDIFGFVPRAMLAQSARFRQGEALMAGGFVAAPSILKVNPRITAEGGIDVPVPMPS
jgi:uncharacterized protein